jgi:hypothetical protein
LFRCHCARQDQMLSISVLGSGFWVLRLCYPPVPESLTPDASLTATTTSNLRRRGSLITHNSARAPFPAGPEAAVGGLQTRTQTTSGPRTARRIYRGSEDRDMSWDLGQKPAEQDCRSSQDQMKASEVASLMAQTARGTASGWRLEFKICLFCKSSLIHAVLSGSTLASHVAADVTCWRASARGKTGEMQSLGGGGGARSS